MAGAVRTYLRADAKGDYGAMANETTGKISQLWVWFNQEYGSCACPPKRLAIKRLHVTRVKGNRATVDLLARIIAEDHVTTISGPMMLVTGPEGWLIQDYRRNGRDFASQIAPLQGEATSGGIEVRALGIGYEGNGSGTLFYEIADRRASAIRIEKIGLRDGGKVFWATAWDSESARMVAAGYVATRGFDWLRPTPLPKKNPDRLELVVSDVGSGRRLTLTLSLKRSS